MAAFFLNRRVRRRIRPKIRKSLTTPKQIKLPEQSKEETDSTRDKAGNDDPPTAVTTTVAIFAHILSFQVLVTSCISKKNILKGYL